MIPIPLIASAIPHLVDLFTSDNKTETALELTKTVANTLGVANNKNAIVEHLNNNPDDIAKIKELEVKALELKYKFELDMLKSKNSHLQNMLDLNNKNTANARNLFAGAKDIYNKLMFHIHLQFYVVFVFSIPTYLYTFMYVTDTSIAMIISTFVTAQATTVANRLNTMDNYFMGSSNKQVDNIETKQDKKVNIN